MKNSAKQKDYEIRIIDDPLLGKIEQPVYVGKTYSFDASITEQNRFKRRCMIFTVAALLLFVCAAMLNNECSRRPLVLVPFAGVAVSLLFCVGAAALTGRAPGSMPERDYFASFRRLRRSTLAIGAAALVAAAANAACLFMQTESITQNIVIKEAAFIALNLAMAALSMISFRHQQRFKVSISSGE